MAREDRSPARKEPEQKPRTAQPREGGSRRKVGCMGRAAASDSAGHGGYGSESVRPYLRAQLRLKELMARAGNLPPNPFEQDQPPHRQR